MRNQDNNRRSSSSSNRKSSGYKSDRSAGSGDRKRTSSSAPRVSAGKRYDSDKPKFESKKRLGKSLPTSSEAGQSEKKYYAPKEGQACATPYGDKKLSPYGDKKFTAQKCSLVKKKPEGPSDGKIRLNRYLSNSGVCSRREADEYIVAGVVKVNDAVVSELGTKVSYEDRVYFHEQLIRPEKKTYILLNKPKNCVTTSDDPQERLTVMDLVKNATSERVYPVGRLDRNTTGVLLLTNDGDMASKLTHPKYNKKKIYHVSLDKALTRVHFDEILAGLQLEDGLIEVDELHYLEDKNDELGVEIHSGRNRIVRRIFESLGYKVMKLDRVYFSGLTKKNLSRGKWRFLSQMEVNALKMGSFD